MRPIPIEHVAGPSYPTRAELLAEPGLLEKRLRRGWQLGRDLAGAVTFFLAINAGGCGDAPPVDVGPGPEAAVQAAETSPDAAGQPSKAAVAAGAVVAPLFAHGEGRGATGCVVVSPPVFLSEDEALQVIKEELARQNIDLKAGTTLKDVAIAPRAYQGVRGEEKRPEEMKVVKDERRAAPLELDGFDAGKRVAVEFVSRADYAQRGGVDPYNAWVVYENGGARIHRSSVSSYDFQDAAKYLAGEVAHQDKEQVIMGVFYDPAARAKDEAKKLLRQQAQDFVAWLAKQGAL